MLDLKDNARVDVECVLYDRILSGRAQDLRKKRVDDRGHSQKPSLAAAASENKQEPISHGEGFEKIKINDVLTLLVVSFFPPKPITITRPTTSRPNSTRSSRRCRRRARTKAATRPTLPLFPRRRRRRSSGSPLSRSRSGSRPSTTACRSLPSTPSAKGEGFVFCVEGAGRREREREGRREETGEVLLRRGRLSRSKRGKTSLLFLFFQKGV